MEGVLQSRSWETGEGQKRSTIDVRAERIQFLGKFAAEGMASNKQLDKIEGEHSRENLSHGEPNGEGATTGSGPLGDAVNPMDVAWDE